MPWPDDPGRVRALRRLAVRLIAEIPPESLAEVGGHLHDDSDYEAVTELADLLGIDEAALEGLG